MDLCFLFKHSAARCEDFKKVQIEMEVEPYNFQQHTEVRWLSMGPSIKRFLEQWDAIIQFVAELAKDTKKSTKEYQLQKDVLDAWTQRQISHRIFPCISQPYHSWI